MILFREDIWKLSFNEARKINLKSHSYFKLHFVISRGRLKEKILRCERKSSVVRILRRNGSKEKYVQWSAMRVWIHGNTLTRESRVSLCVLNKLLLFLAANENKSKFELFFYMRKHENHSMNDRHDQGSWSYLVAFLRIQSEKVKCSQFLIATDAHTTSTA